MPKGDPSDEQGVLISKMKHAFSTYDSAAKKYLGAVKDLDNAMEAIAIALRELSQGEVDDAVRGSADRLCSAIDAHKSAKSTASAETGLTGGMSYVNNEENYFFSVYMSDFAREVTTSLEELKTFVKETEKVKEKRDSAVRKYQKTRMEVDEMETKLAKKNQGIADNDKYAKKVAHRDELKTKADIHEEQFTKKYDAMVNKRTEVLQRMVSAMGSCSSTYYTGIAKVMRAPL